MTFNSSGIKTSIFFDSSLKVIFLYTVYEYTTKCNEQGFLVIKCALTKKIAMCKRAVLRLNYVIKNLTIKWQLMWKVQVNRLNYVSFDIRYTIRTRNRCNSTKHFNVTPLHNNVVSHFPFTSNFKIPFYVVILHFLTGT